MHVKSIKNALRSYISEVRQFGLIKIIKFLPINTFDMNYDMLSLLNIF